MAMRRVHTLTVAASELAKLAGMHKYEADVGPSIDRLLQYRSHQYIDDAIRAKARAAKEEEERARAEADRIKKELGRKRREADRMRKIAAAAKATEKSKEMAELALNTAREAAAQHNEAVANHDGRLKELKESARSAPKRIKLTVPNSDTELALRMATPKQLVEVKAALEMPAGSTIDEAEQKLKAVATASVAQPTAAAATAAAKPVNEALSRAAPAVAEALNTRISKSRGEALESKGLDRAEETRGAPLARPQNTKFCTLCKFEHKDTPWRVQVVGKVDGFDEAAQEVIEHKQRRNRLFRRVQEYERIQMEAYFRICGCKTGRLVETFDDEQLEHCVRSCDALWNQVARRVQNTLIERVIEPYIVAIGASY